MVVFHKVRVVFALTTGSDYENRPPKMAKDSQKIIQSYSEFNDPRLNDIDSIGEEYFGISTIRI